MFYHRGFSHDVEALHFKVIVLCAIFCVSTFGPCTMTGTHSPTGYIDLNTGSENVLIGDTRKQIQPPKLNIENICKRSDLFCFPSTLSDFLSDFYITEANNSGFSGVKLDETVVVTNELRSTNHGNFELLNGNIVSCSLELKENIQDSNENDTPFVRIKSNRVNDFSLPNVQISHPLLDWGQKYLHIPSLAYLTVENRHKNSPLQVFEPYSTNRQFYPCNNSEIKIGPAQNASICFVFLPKWLGSSSGQLILQTSSGGFLVRAQGFAVEPPYMIQSSVGSGSGSGPRVVSVFNPSDKELLVKEVNAWISFSSRNASYSVSGVCNVMNQTGSSGYKFNKQLEVKIGQLGQQVMMMSPQKTWTVGPNRNEPILDLEFLFHSQENIHGLFCVQLLKTDSRDKFDTLVFEAEFGGKLVKDILLISLDVLMACDGNGTTIVSLLVENDSPDLLTVVNISQLGENEASLQTKYVKGLILFPHSVTQIATVTYSPNSHTNLNCKLVVQTNKSKDHELEISCSEIARLCSRENLNYENAETKSSNVQVQPSSEIKATEMTKADESVLGNWRSHKTQNGFSVLDDNELIFPMVQIGQYQSKWVNIINPSNQPVIVQLVLNSGEIITECREWDEILNPYSSYNLVLGNQKTPSRYGFSIPENALTEAYVHPHGNTVLGPIVFHPSDRCSWKSSVLVRNNLSGVEWLSLRGSGGSVLLTLLDRSNPVHRIELKHNYGQLFMRVLYAKNTGDLPVKVDKISVSGTKCELNGFIVGSCKGFDLQPGGSQKIIILYFSEYCAETVRRDLELGMTGGILVIPMEVSLPVETRKVCKRFLFWTRFKKFAVGVLILVIFMVCFGTYSFIIKGGNSSVVGSITEIPDSVPESVEEVTTSASSDVAAEESKPENLRVNTRARRRRKKRNSGVGSTGPNEASSSHSSNSTPSASMPSSPCQNVRAVNHGGTSAVLPPEEKEEKPSILPKTASPSAQDPEVERDVELIQVISDDERAPEVKREVVEPIQENPGDEQAPEVAREVVEPIQEIPNDERAPEVKRDVNHVIEPIQEIPNDERAPEVKRDVVEPIQEIPNDERAPEVKWDDVEPIQEIPNDERAPEVVRDVVEPIQEIPNDERASEVERDVVEPIRVIPDDERAPEVNREVVEPIQEIPDVERAPDPEVEREVVEEIREENDDWLEYNMWDHHLQLRAGGSIGPVMPGENNFSSFFNMSPQDLFGPYKLQTHVSSKEED